MASWYDELAQRQGTEFHQAVVIPGVLRLLALTKGERVLDQACGQGAVTLALHKVGAEVTGVDLSKRMVEMARQRSPRSLRYLVADARKLDALEAGSFDAVVSVLAAQNIDPIAPVFSEAARLLRRGGRLVVVLLHPAFRIPRQSSWQFDERRKLMMRATDRYLTPLSIPIDAHPHRRPEQQVTWTYHRPLQDYVRALAQAGLMVDGLEEWASHKVSQPGPMAKAENRARQEFPLFLALRAVKAQA